MEKWIGAAAIWLAVPFGACGADTGDRLRRLDEYVNPYCVGLETPKLVTPQWIGEKGVEAAIVLAVDDMTDAGRYEEFLRPILARLQRIDGRAPVSIMTKHIDPQLPRLQQWLDEGLTIEAHTYDHPCPCLQGGDLAKAKGTFDRCVDLLATIPRHRPVAFRMPCCDSMNSVSPRFFTEVFGKTTPGGRFLTMDSSVFQLFTAADPDLPRQLVVDREGDERFRKYLPVDRDMANYIENYPYPYVVDRLCWEFPPLMPSDWDAQYRNGKCSPITVEDMKAAIDAIVVKKGVFSLCFHPHGWIAADQVIELIDHATTRHGRKVKFLTFGEAQACLNEHLLGGGALRADDGRDNGVRLGDVNNDGFMDVMIGNRSRRQTRLWSPEDRRWRTAPFPVKLVEEDEDGRRIGTGAHFGILDEEGRAVVLIRNERTAGMWRFDGRRWARDPDGLRGLDADGPVMTAAGGRDCGVRLRDLDRDGVCELIVSNPRLQAVFGRVERGWRRLPFQLPQGATVVDAEGRDAGLRLTDLDQDGRDDVVFSNAERYSAHLFTSMEEGWSRMVRSGRRGRPGALPMIVRADGTNNGAWFALGRMWVQNEDTGGALPNHVESRSFAEDFLRDEKAPTPARPIRR